MVNFSFQSWWLPISLSLSRLTSSVQHQYKPAVWAGSIRISGRVTSKMCGGRGGRSRRTGIGWCESCQAIMTIEAGDKASFSGRLGNVLNAALYKFAPDHAVTVKSESGLAMVNIIFLAGKRALGQAMHAHWPLEVATVMVWPHSGRSLIP